MITIGSVWVEDCAEIDSDEAIRRGYIDGDGLLGELLDAYGDLDMWRGWKGSFSGTPKAAEFAEKIGATRMKIYGILKQIEAAGAGND